MRRFDAAQGAHSPSFDRRRSRMLRLSCLLIFLNLLPWVVTDLVLGRVTLSLLELGFLGATVLVWLLTRGALLRIASLLFTLISMVGLLGLSLALDVPTAAVARSTHHFLIPLTVAFFFLLQYEAPLIRSSLPALCLAAFVVLASSSSGFGFAPLIGDEERRIAATVAPLLAGVALYAVMVVMLREIKEASALEQAFSTALTRGEIEAYLQPQCRADGSLVGAEALMRWRHPERGTISPAEFIPMAERSGLIIPAGEQILAAVCALLQRWEQEPALRGLSVAVNVSPVQLFSGDSAARLLARVPESVSRRGVLKFELTETMFVQDIDRVRECMAQIRARGIGLALDDFGTGFSSLNYLHQLPLDQIKIDQSFVSELPDDASAGKIARSIVQLGNDLGLEVIAEGTETTAQVTTLREMGCELFQGYLFSRPLPVEAFEAMAREVHAGRRSLVES